MSSYSISHLSTFFENGVLNIFDSAYKDLRFNVTFAKYIIVDSTYEANLPGLSYDTYGTTELWRVILYANGLCDPMNDVVVGVRLGLPSLDSVAAYLLRFQNKNKPVVI